MKTPRIFLVASLIILLASCKNDSKPLDKDVNHNIVEENNPIIADSNGHNTAVIENIDTTTMDSARSTQVEIEDSILIIEANLSNNDVPKEVETSNPSSKPIRPKKKSKPRITFEKTIHNFGNIEQGEVIEFSFKFINSGNAPLVITNASATCGCTHPTYPFLPIEPNETGSIGVRYDSKGKFGSQKPLITLHTNADPAEVKLYLEGMVKKGLEKAADAKDSI